MVASWDIEPCLVQVGTAGRVFISISKDVFLARISVKGLRLGRRGSREAVHCYLVGLLPSSTPF